MSLVASRVLCVCSSMEKERSSICSISSPINWNTSASRNRILLFTTKWPALNFIQLNSVSPSALSLVASLSGLVPCLLVTSLHFISSHFISGTTLSMAHPRNRRRRICTGIHCPFSRWHSLSMVDDPLVSRVSLTMISDIRLGSYLLSGGHECVLVKWLYRTSEPTFRPRLGAPILHLTSSNDQTFYVSTHSDNSAWTWRVASIKFPLYLCLSS